LPARLGLTYLVSLDVGIVNDRTVLAVMHAEDTPGGRGVVLDRICRWQGTRGAPVDLGEVRDTLVALAREFRAAVVVDPHQAVLIAQEARGAGVRVTEFAFTSASVGRLALSLHQAIRNHRIALPDDGVLLDELVSVRLRKNTLGVYRLDHDAGQHDDQAIALALAAHHLLDADDGAERWIRWVREKAEVAAGVREPPEPRRVIGPVPVVAAPVGGQDGAALEGVVVDPVALRKAARDRMWREQRGVVFGYLGAAGPDRGRSG
jgi:hypothetical protein